MSWAYGGPSADDELVGRAAAARGPDEDEVTATEEGSEVRKGRSSSESATPIMSELLVRREAMYGSAELLSPSTGVDGRELTDMPTRPESGLGATDSMCQSDSGESQ